MTLVGVEVEIADYSEFAFSKSVAVGDDPSKGFGRCAS
jgi:hypothetical protein